MKMARKQQMRKGSKAISAVTIDILVNALNYLPKHPAGISPEQIAQEDFNRDYFIKMGDTNVFVASFHASLDEFGTTSFEVKSPSEKYSDSIMKTLDEEPEVIKEIITELKESEFAA